jgi:proline iminopeptidase
MTGGTLYPPIEPYESGLLETGDGNLVYWEACGNPDGKPALVVHGGPGSGCTPGHRQYFDPQRYRVILFDQRGCGRSRPHASDPATDMSSNTTSHLIADMEQLRGHLGVQQWLLSGSSWGSTLILAYAEQYPQHVSGVVITGVTTTTRAEIDWLYRGLACYLPGEWERFRAGAPEAEHDADVVAAYARLMEHPAAQVRAKAADHWHAWEDATISLEPGGHPGSYSDRPPAELLARARICSHYFAHAAWLEEGALLRDVARLAAVPAVLIHGRLDLGSPVGIAWALARAWPGAELAVIRDSGHSGNDAMSQKKREALDHLASRLPSQRAPDLLTRLRDCREVLGEQRRHLVRGLLGQPVGGTVELGETVGAGDVTAA